MPTVTIDGKVIGRLTEEFSGFFDVMTYVEAWCLQRRRSIDVTFTIPPTSEPLWNLPSGATYNLTVVYDSSSDEVAHTFTLLSEG